MTSAKFTSESDEYIKLELKAQYCKAQHSV